MKVIDVMHLYLGSQVIVCPFGEISNSKDKLIGIETREQGYEPWVRLDSGRLLDASEIKLILRPLLSMTEDEHKEQQKLMTLTTDGVHIVGIYTNTPESFAWLLSKGFDIFNLHDQQECIYESDLTQ